MARVSEVDAQEAPEEITTLYEEIESKFGLVPRLFRTLAHQEGLARSTFDGYKDLWEGGSLDWQLKEKIAVAVSAANDCEYCVSAHTMLLKNILGTDEDEVQAIVERRYDALPEREQVAVEFAVAAVRDANDIPEQCYEALAETFTEQEIVEITGVAMRFQGVNLFVDALEVEPEF